MALEETGVRFIAGDVQSYISKMNAAAKATADVGKTATESSKDVDGLDKVMSKFGRDLRAGIHTAVIAVAGLGAAAVATGFSFNAMRQSATNTFTKLFQDGQMAKAFLDELQKFAAKTPFEFPELVKASQRLLAVGFNAQDIIPTLNAVGDAVAGIGGNAQQIDRVVNSLAQIKTRGRATVGDINQLVEAGIPAWRYLAEAIGVSIPEAMKKAEDGTITASVAVKALTDGMNKDFKGMMEEQSRTFNGLLSTLKDTFAQISSVVLGPFFEKATEAMQKLVDYTNTPEFTRGLEKFRADVEAITDAFETGFNAVVLPALKWVLDNGYAIAAVVTLIGLAFAWAHPGGALILGLTAIIGLIGLLKADIDSLPPNLIRVRIAFLQFGDAAVNVLKYVGREFITSMIGPLDLIATSINTIIAGFNAIPNIRIPGVGQVPDINFRVPSIADMAADFLIGLVPGQDFFKDQIADAEEAFTAAVDRMANSASSAAPKFERLGTNTDSAGEKAEKAAEKTKTYAERLSEALEDGIITLEENREKQLDLTAAQAGALEASAYLTEQMFRQEEATFNLGKAVESLKQLAVVGGTTFASFVDNMITKALELQRQAVSGIFSRPTREEALLQLQLAEVNRAIAGFELTGGPARDLAKKKQADLNAEIDRMKNGLDENVRNLQRNKEAQTDALRDIDTKNEAESDAIQKRIRDLDRDTDQQIQNLRDATERQIKAKQDEIKAIEEGSNAQIEAYKRLAEQIQGQLSLMQQENEIQKLRAVLADESLPNELEQNNAIVEVTRNIGFLSTELVATKSVLKDSLIPEFNAAAKAAKFVTEAFGLSGVTTPGLQHGGVMITRRPRLVGEHGPELFVPSTSGTVYPMKQVPIRWPTNQPAQSTFNNQMSIDTLSLPNVLSGEQLIDQLDRRQSRRLRLQARGALA